MNCFWSGAQGRRQQEVRVHVHLSININHSFCSLPLFVNSVCEVNKKKIKNGSIALRHGKAITNSPVTVFS